jgi:hypothetical protein
MACPRASNIQLCIAISRGGLTGHGPSNNICMTTARKSPAASPCTRASDKHSAPPLPLPVSRSYTIQISWDAPKHHIAMPMELRGAKLLHACLKDDQRQAFEIREECFHAIITFGTSSMREKVLRSLRHR